VRKHKRISSSFFPFLSTPNFLFRFYYKYERKLFSLIFRKKEEKAGEKRKSARGGRTDFPKTKRRRVRVLIFRTELEVRGKLIQNKKEKVEEKQRKSHIHFPSFFLSNFP
jgi:hypothetical protein